MNTLGVEYALNELFLYTIAYASKCFLCWRIILIYNLFHLNIKTSTPVLHTYYQMELMCMCDFFVIIKREKYLCQKSEGKKIMKIKAKTNQIRYNFCSGWKRVLIGLDMTYYLFGIVNMAKMHGLHS